ncbi:hypothetical protein DPMN_165783 [Dreissena polymorpha]|uniref:Succinate dehydrogenase [ubiquinone] cytochrome b small subunit n=1 Tax=Dreissena polymorpha TaxID=45954 RepID=A0A9D4ITK5_DREPO|nr:hypothetical protein DPMN_165783 [Dreissena polymorpha]
MASSALLLRLGRGGPVLFRSNVARTGVTCLMRQQVPANTFILTPASSAALDYFKARRGPFTPGEKQGKHMIFSSTHWKIERILAVSMIGIMPGAFFFQGPAMDFIFTTSVFMHAFWAFDHVLSDYVQKFFPPIHMIWLLPCSGSCKKPYLFDPFIKEELCPSNPFP